MESKATLQDAILYFANFENCLRFMTELRWPNGKVKCPICGAEKVTFLAKRRVWKCYASHAKPTFSLKTGTIFEDSPIPLEKWLPAAWLLIGCKNGISSYELHSALGVTQKTAWFMLQRIRLAMQDGTFNKLSGRVEVDETFIGGKARNMHKAKRDRVITGTGGKDKKDFQHAVINHAVEYANGTTHTNSMENFWSLLKRGLHGTYISVEPFHLFRYIDEQAFRFNNRKMTDAERFAIVMKQIVGRRLT
jgi:transposase-like protein